MQDRYRGIVHSIQTLLPRRSII